MSPRGAHLAALAALALGAPAARADEPAPSAPAAEAAAPEPCAASRECARREGRGHVCAEGRCVEYWDRRDLFAVLGLRASPPGAPEPWKPLVAAVPAIGYSPSSGVLFGAAGTMGMMLGEGADTTISNATGTLLYTSKSQLIAQVATTALTAGNEWVLLGDWRLLLFNQDTFGLGTGTPPIGDGFSINGWGELAPVPGAQPMDFNLLRLHQAALKQVAGSFYLGLGYRLDRYYDIVDRRLDLEASPPVVTSHHGYSTIQGFSTRAYTTSSLALEFISDSRDSTIAPYRGHYAHVRLGAAPTWLGSSQESATASLEGRAYLGLSDDDPRNLLALWAMASWIVSGRVPYLALPANGWDARSTSSRGYVQGRFRGTSNAYAEAEWRFRLSADGLFGGTVFANAQTYARPALGIPAVGYSEPGERLFESVRVAGGVGLRIMLLKQSRTALRIDLAGGQGAFAFYLGAGEAF